MDRLAFLPERSTQRVTTNSRSGVLWWWRRTKHFTGAAHDLLGATSRICPTLHVLPTELDMKSGWDRALTVTLVLCAIVSTGLIARHEFFPPPDPVQRSQQPAYLESWQSFLRSAVLVDRQMPA